jgi:hypothetical protein
MSLLVRICSVYFDNVLSSLNSVSSVDSRVITEQARAAMEGGKSQSIAAFLASLIIFFYFHFHLHEPMAAWWFLFSCVYMGVRSFMMWRYYRRTDIDQDIDIWAKRYVTLAFTSGLVWSLISWMLIPKNDLAVTFALIMTLMSICVTSAFELAVYKRAVFAFLLPMGLMPFVALLWQQQTSVWSSYSYARGAQICASAKCDVDVCIAGALRKRRFGRTVDASSQSSRASEQRENTFFCCCQS